MALCESQLESGLGLQDGHEARDQSPTPREARNGDVFPGVPGALPLTVDYRSPVSHFIPPAVEMFRHTDQLTTTGESSGTSGAPTPVKRKRGRPRVDKTSPEYLANLAARKQAREMGLSEEEGDLSPNGDEEAAMMNRSEGGTPTGEKRKRGRPRVDKTSPEYLARKRQRELEALERKAKREYRRRTTGAKPAKTKLPVKVTRTQKIPISAKRPVGQRAQRPAGQRITGQRPTGQRLRKIPAKIQAMLPAKIPKKLPAKNAKLRKVTKIGDKVKKQVVIRRNTKFIKRKDSAASSSAGETTPRVKRKYTKRASNANKTDTPQGEKAKGKRGRPRKVDQTAANNKTPQQQPKIRVRSNLMPTNHETITLDSDDEPDLGSPSQASDLSFDENLRALRHIHEKYANIDKDDLYEAHLLAANFKKPTDQRLKDDDEVLSIRSSEGNASVKELETRVEKLEDSSGSDSDSSSSGSGSSSSGSDSSSSSSGSSSSDSSSDSEDERPSTPAQNHNNVATNNSNEDDRSFGAWSYSNPQSDSGSDSDPERLGDPEALRAEQDEISESENESADKSFQCHICRKWYSTRVTLKIHRRSHLNRSSGTARSSRARSSDRYECDCCNETFNRREKLLEHKANVHRGAMTVRCEVCRKCFEDDAELAAHDAMHTADERAGRCSECGAMFSRYDQLRRHRACAHGAATAVAPGGSLAHACAQCGKRFSHAHSLTRHMHNHAKQLYRCVVCKASFARADQLAQHLNSHLANYKRLKP